ncbi:MAG TPA: GNAT family N-acetyltransferase [Kineosporiaceae bacterium]
MVPEPPVAVPAPSSPAGTHPPQIDVVAVTRDDAPAVLDVDRWAFGLDGDVLLPDDLRAVVDSLVWERTFGARLGGAERLAGVYSVVPGQLTVPGNRSVPCAGLSWVGVHPRDRRRGVLTAMMRHHLDDVAGHGEVVSLLHAAETMIYGRFGYGAATQAVNLRLPRAAALRDVPGAADLWVDFHRADADAHAPLVARCFDAAQAARPGWLSRSHHGLRREAFLDPRRRRSGAESLKLATVTDPDGALRAYALFRRRGRWENHAPAGVVEVTEAVALDGAAAHALWSRLADLDLTVTVDTPLLAVDDPLLHLLADPRAAGPTVTDGVWARLVDVPAALAARGYAGPLDVVLGVTDPLRPANTGRWHLVAGPGDATCTRTDAPAQLELGVRELATAYLGGPTLAALAHAGLVRVHDATALAQASVAFASSMAPHCGWLF